MQIKIYDDPKYDNYGELTKVSKSKTYCSVKCKADWTKSIPWEDRVGHEWASQFRAKMSKLSTENNPSTFPGVGEKIGASLSAYLQENPRTGEKNPFFGQKHAQHTIDHLRTSKKGKRAYNQEQYEKAVKNTRRGENHHNWNGGSSYGPYGSEFTRELKQQIKESYKFICQLCDQESDKLDIHHIDYNKKNNALDNLIPLCKTCHGQTNYNRDSWIPICKAKVKLKVD